MTVKKSDISCIDLFCGAGGLTHGLVTEGLKVVAGIDIDAACKHPYEQNNGAKFLQMDVSDVSVDLVNSLFGNAKIRVLAGCAPCQPFSTYSQRYDTIGSAKWALLYEFGRLIKGVLPEIVTMENVPKVSRHTVYNDFVRDVKKMGYHVWEEDVECVWYGLPQRRKRKVLLASRFGPIELIPKTHDEPATVRDAIGRLPKIRAGAALISDPLHTSATLSKLNQERIQFSIPGGTWKDWPRRLVSKCHKKESGKTYSGVYGRMEWDKPAPTLTTQYIGFGNGRFGHPEQNRALSLREGAILQGFPINYSFAPEGSPIYLKTFARLIGNAVPVTLGKAIAKSIGAHVKAYL